MFLFITETPKDIHVTKYSYITDIKNQEALDQLLIKLVNSKKEKCCDYYQFETFEDAKIFMDESILNDTLLNYLLNLSIIGHLILPIIVDTSLVILRK